MPEACVTSLGGSVSIISGEIGHQRNRCHRYLLPHVLAHQRAAAKDIAIESARGRFAGQRPNGGLRDTYARTGIPVGRLRHPGVAAGNDAHFGLPLHGGILRLGSGLDSAPGQDSTSIIILSDRRFRNFVRAAGK